MGWTNCTLRSVSRAAHPEVRFRWMEIRGEPEAPGLDLFVCFFLALTCLFVRLCYDNKNRWKEGKKGRMGQRNNGEWGFFSVHLLCLSEGVWSEHTANGRFLPLITATVWKYEACLAGAFVRCHHALSLVLIQRSPALKITALVCWSASWLIVSRPPKTQREACRIIVFFITVWVVSRSCELVCMRRHYRVASRLLSSHNSVCAPEIVHVCVVYAQMHPSSWRMCFACRTRTAGARVDKCHLLFCQQTPVYSLLINCVT